MKIATYTRFGAARSAMTPRCAGLCAALAVIVAMTGCAAGNTGTLAGQMPPIAAGDPLSASQYDMAAQFHILAGEMAIQRGMPERAVKHYIAALQYVDSRKLAERATQIALYAGSRQQAYTAAQEWAQLAPESLAAQRTAAHLALALGKPHELLDYSLAVLAAAPTREKGYHLLADAFSGAPKHSKLAVATLRQLAAQDKNSASASYVLGLVALRYGQLETAGQAAQHAVKLKPEWAKASLLKAAVLVRQGQSARAQAVIDALPGSRAQRSQYHLSLARLLLDSGQSQAALNEFERALALQPDSTQARYDLAVLAFSLGKLERARAAFKQLYKAGERTNEAAYYLAAIRERNGAWAAAERWYRRVEGGGQALSAKIDVARMLAKQGNIAGARQRLEELRAQYPRMSNRLSAAEGRILLVAGRYQEALAVYNDALNPPHTNNALLYGRSLVYEKLGQIDKAIDDLKTVLAQDTDNSRALNALGYLLTNHTERYGKALRLISRALSLDPGNPAILDSLGWVQYHLGHLDKALDYLQRAYKALPDPAVAAHLGTVLWQLGQRERARRIWRKALADNPDNETLQKTVAKFTP